GVPESYICLPAGNWSAYGLLGAIDCGAAGTFQTLALEKARQGAAWAAVAMTSASVAMASASAARAWARTRPTPALLSWGCRSIHTSRFRWQALGQWRLITMCRDAFNRRARC